MTRGGPDMGVTPCAKRHAGLWGAVYFLQIGDMRCFDLVSSTVLGRGRERSETMNMSHVPGDGSAGPQAHAAPVCHEEDICDLGVVTVVEAFLPGVDRLLLDFDAGTELPGISLDTETVPGSTAVLGNGAPMVLVRGVTEVRPADITLRNLPPPIDPDVLRAVKVVKDFDPKLDIVEVLYDPLDGGAPLVEVRDFADKSGAAVIVNGRPILALRGTTGISPEDIRLIPRDRH